MEASGLEPPTPGLQSRCSPRLSYAPDDLLMLSIGRWVDKAKRVHGHALAQWVEWGAMEEASRKRKESGGRGVEYVWGRGATARQCESELAECGGRL